MDLFSSPPPLAPPTSEGNELSWLRLLRSRRVGPGTFRRLMAEHGHDAEAALAALPEIARTAGLKDYAPCPAEAAERELVAGRRAGAVPIFLDHPAYPPTLAEAEEAPPMLWARGQTDLLARPAVALVGARNASSLGLRMARAMASGLGAEGFVCVSGLARGIDGESHRATLQTGTIAVVAGGVDVVYPREHEALMAEIAERGLVLSERPPGMRPQGRDFPRRNRIVAGLARALVVVEAAAKSGSLITARDAADLGREVFAVPGHPFDARAAGCNMLLRDGATLVRGPADVLAAIGPVPQGSPPGDTDVAGSGAAFGRAGGPAAVSPDAEPGAATGAEPGSDRGAVAPGGSGAQGGTGRIRCPRPSAPPSGPGDGAAGDATQPDARARILDRLGPSPTEEDALWRDTALPRPAFAALLTELEMEGAVTRAPGGLLSRANG